MEKHLKGDMYCSVLQALMPFAGTTEQRLLQSIPGYCSYLSLMPLRAVLGSCYCLRLHRPAQTVQSTEPAWPLMQQPVAATRRASSIPTAIPARAPASLQFRDEPNSLVKPACVFLDNSFLHNLDLRHLFSAAAQLPGRTHDEVLEEQSFPWHLTGALVTCCLCRGGAIMVLAGACAHHVPSGPSPEAHLTSSLKN